MPVYYRWISIGMDDDKKQVAAQMSQRAQNGFKKLSEQLSDTETLKKAASEWGRMNWVRSLIWLAGLVCSFLALDKATSSTQKLS